MRIGRDAPYNPNTIIQTFSLYFKEYKGHFNMISTHKNRNKFKVFWTSMRSSLNLKQASSQGQIQKDALPHNVSEGCTYFQIYIPSSEGHCGHNMGTFVHKFLRVNLMALAVLNPQDILQFDFGCQNQIPKKEYTLITFLVIILFRSRTTI